MRIGIVGTGKMGRAFAQALGGTHEVWFASRDAGRARAAAEETGGAGGGTYDDALPDAEVVILTVPWFAALDTLRGLPDLTGKVLIDVTNPYVDGKLVPLEGSSTGEEVQRATPARVVKGWNHVYAVNVTRPDFGGIAASVFVAGDDEDAKATVAGLARDMGFDPVDIGGIEKSRVLERFLQLQYALTLTPERGLRIITREG